MEQERRISTLTVADIEAIKKAISGDVPWEVQVRHHNIFRDWLEKEEKKAQRRERMKSQIIGSVIVGVTTGIGAALYTFGEEAVKFIKEHLK
jgi:hypothetical protein